MGLLRTAARTAVITGTATRVHHRVAARQQPPFAQQTAAPTPSAPPTAAAPPAAAPPVAAPTAAPAPAAPDTGGMLAHLRELGELRDAGVLTEAEFAVQKDRILSR